MYILSTKMQLLAISTLLLLLPHIILAQSHTHVISTTWDGVPLPANATVTISFTPGVLDPFGNPSLLFTLQSPHYNDPLPPDPVLHPPHLPLIGLWDYEVVELFFLGEGDEYLEIELSPSSHYVLLYLKGRRNDTGMYLPLRNVSIEHANASDPTQLPTWTGEAYIPAQYFPCNISKFNAYAIHGSDEAREYLSLFPVTPGEIPGPDFHYLPAFREVALEEINPLCWNYDHKINKTWNGQDLGEEYHISFQIVGEELLISINAPFFNDPQAPEGPTSDPWPGLWDYEVVELFFLGEDDEYLEIELAPSGHYLLLYLAGYRNDTGRVLPLQGFSAQVVNSTEDASKQRWIGRASIPGAYFPCNVTKFNAYSIFGSGEARSYNSLFPVLGGELEQPDFHFLPAFGGVELGGEVNVGCRDGGMTSTTTTQRPGGGGSGRVLTCAGMWVGLLLALFLL